MRERKMFFPPALRLAAVAIALSAAALALPLPVFAVLDRAAGHSIAVQQDAEALSPAGRSCAAARELYCWRMTWQNTSRTMVEPDSTPASTAPTLAAVQQLQAAGVLPASMADVLLSAMQQTDSCTTYTDDTGQSEYVFTSDENHVTLTLTASGLPVGFTVEQCSFADSALDEIADAYAAFLGGDAITDWETLPLQLHERYATASVPSFTFAWPAAGKGCGCRQHRSPRRMPPLTAGMLRHKGGLPHEKDVQPDHAVRCAPGCTVACARRLCCLFRLQRCAGRSRPPPLPPRNRQRNLICPACARCTRGMKTDIIPP